MRDAAMGSQHNSTCLMAATLSPWCIMLIALGVLQDQYSRANEQVSGVMLKLQESESLLRLHQVGFLSAAPTVQQVAMFCPPPGSSQGQAASGRSSDG